MALGDQILDAEMDLVYARDEIAKKRFGEPKIVSRSRRSKLAFVLLNAIWPTSLHYEMGRLRQMGALLNLAYQDMDSPISSAKLEREIDGLTDRDYVTRRWPSMKEPTVRDARRELLRQKYLLFRQILEQDSVADSYEDALRRQFGTRENYLAALQPVLEANEAYLSVSEKFDPGVDADEARHYMEIYRTLLETQANQAFTTE